ncbi:uncharacterized protein [Arachis hypogaea]|uniref:uncharacterized protein isoform X2 n=1 Tax=Arachis hypogaea TaxID=3818 RepID=UPI0034E663A5
MQRSGPSSGLRCSALELILKHSKSTLGRKLWSLRRKKKSAEISRCSWPKIESTGSTAQILDLKKKQENQVQLLKQKEKSEETAKKLGGRIYSQAHKTFRGCLSSSRTQTWGGCFGLAYEKKSGSRNSPRPRISS